MVCLLSLDGPWVPPLILIGESTGYQEIINVFFIGKNLIVHGMKTLFVTPVYWRITLDTMLFHRLWYGLVLFNWGRGGHYSSVPILYNQWEGITPD